jgi:hypothetical protein
MPGTNARNIKIGDKPMRSKLEIQSRIVESIARLNYLQTGRASKADLQIQVKQQPNMTNRI